MKDVHESAVAVQQDDDDEMTFSWTSITHTGGIPAHFNMRMGAWMEKDTFDGSGGIESPCASRLGSLYEEGGELAFGDRMCYEGRCIPVVNNKTVSHIWGFGGEEVMFSRTKRSL
jgi:hypothetical protein